MEVEARNFFIILTYPMTDDEELHAVGPLHRRGTTNKPIHTDTEKADHGTKKQCLSSSASSLLALQILLKLPIPPA
jgi:hypothetical protein